MSPVSDCDKPQGFGIRHYQTMMICFAMMIAYSLRMNLSVAIVAMTDTEPSASGIPTLEWDTSRKGIILSSIFVGYVLLQILAGHLARTLGPKYLLLGAMTVCSVVTLLSPYIALNFNWVVFCLGRFVIGLGQGFFVPCLNVLVAKWAPPSEVNRIYAFMNVGSQSGATLTLFGAGYLAASPWGWPSIFYVTGLCSILWSLVWLLVGADSPDSHPSISDIERNYIKKSLINSSDHSSTMRTPWRQIWTSGPVWALIISSFCFAWTYWTMATMLPTYFNSVLGFDIKNNGLLASLPYMLKCFLIIMLSWITDISNNYNWIPLSVSRKIWNSFAMWGGAAALTALTVTNSVPGAAVLLTISVVAGAGVCSGFFINQQDLAPNFAGLIIGIANGFGSINAILGPMITGFIVTDENNRDQWMVAFYICIGGLFVGNLVFVVFGSASVQTWNEPDDKHLDIRCNST